MPTSGETGTTFEKLIFDVVRHYVISRVESKHDTKLKDCKGKRAKEEQFNDHMLKVARVAFLAVRSRTPESFVDYFSGTICSVPQSMGHDRYMQLSRGLLEEPDKARTLTMLALSANTRFFYHSNKSDDSKE